MKKNIYTSIILVFITACSFAQTNVNNMLVRHDTTLLKADECEWIIKSLVKNDPALTSEIGKPVTQIILEAIKRGKIKAIDPETNKPIPAKEIFTWRISPDTVMIYDTEGEGMGGSRYELVQRTRSVDNLQEIRIYQDWYFEIATGKFQSRIKWIELMEDINTSMGIYLGKAPLCRIYY